MSIITMAPGRCRVVIAVFAVAAITGGLFLASSRGRFRVRQDRVLVVYGYSTLDDVMRDGILPAFRETWLRERGERIEFAATFAGSGDVIDMVMRKVPAEVAIVTSELDARRIPGPFLSWTALPHGGVLARSPLVIVVRHGNPHGIRGFDDLARPGIDLLHADPATSGAACLAVLAEHGPAQPGQGERERALQRLQSTWSNVTTLLPSSREARRRFEQGAGDALITYEQDVVATPSRPAIDGEVIHPRSTIVAEPIVVKVGANLEDRQRELVDALVEFLWSPEAQEIAADYGFRSVLEDVHASRTDLVRLDEPLTLADFGGWKACRDVLDLWREAVLPVLQR